MNKLKGVKAKQKDKKSLGDLGGKDFVTNLKTMLKKEKSKKEEEEAKKPSETVPEVRVNS